MPCRDPVAEPEPDPERQPKPFTQADSSPDRSPDRVANPRPSDRSADRAADRDADNFPNRDPAIIGADRNTTAKPERGAIGERVTPIRRCAGTASRQANRRATCPATG